MVRNSPESGNQVVNRIFARGSDLAQSMQDDGSPEDSPLYQFALMANLAAGLHDSRYSGVDDLESAFKMAKMGGQSPLVFEDQGPENFGFRPSAVDFVLTQRRAGNGDAALQQVLQASRLTEFGPNGPLLSAGKRLDRLTKPMPESLYSSLASISETETKFSPVTLTRTSRNNDYPPMAVVLTEALLPALDRINSGQALKTIRELSIIDLAIRSVQPDIAVMIGGVASSQERQIGTFMNSVERAIETAAAGLRKVVGLEITDRHSEKISGTIRMDDSGRAMTGLFAARDGREIGAQRKHGTTGSFNGSKNVTDVHRERPMAAGRVRIEVGPSTIHSEASHFAATAVPLNRDASAYHQADESGAFASASGHSVVASNVTHVSSTANLGGITIVLEVNP